MAIGVRKGKRRRLPTMTDKEFDRRVAGALRALREDLDAFPVPAVRR